MAFLEVAGGVVLGAALAESAARLARRDERQHARRERVLERQREAAEELFRALDKAHAKLPAFTSSQVPGIERYWEAQRCWQDGLFEAGGYLRHAELRERYDAAGWALLTCALDAHHRPRSTHL